VFEDKAYADEAVHAVEKAVGHHNDVGGSDVKPNTPPDATEVQRKEMV